MDVFELSSKRFTTKHYNPTRKISNADIAKLKEILRLTPSAMNSQPWHFIFGSSDTAKELIRPAVAEFNWARTDDCSHFVVLCIKEKLDDAYLSSVIEQEDKDGRFTDAADKETRLGKLKAYVGALDRKGRLDAWKTHQAYLAMASLLYGSASLGIDSTAIEGYFPRKLDEVLGLSAKGLRSVAIVTLGYGAPDDANATRPKSRLASEVIFSELD